MIIAVLSVFHLGIALLATARVSRRNPTVNGVLLYTGNLLHNDIMIKLLKY